MGVFDLAAAVIKNFGAFGGIRLDEIQADVEA